MPRRMLLLIAAGEVLGMTLWFSATAAAPSVAREFALDPATGAWLTMAVQAGFVAGTLLTALTNAADAINARRLFAAGCVVGAVCNAAITLVPTAGAIIALRFCTGAALAWVYPPGMKIAAGWFRERRGTALGVVVGAVGVGSAFPHLLAWLGAGLPWRTLVGASSMLALAGAALVALAVTDGPYVSASAPFDRHALRVVLRNRGARLAMLGYFGHMWELYAMWTWMAAFAAASLASTGLASTGLTSTMARHGSAGSAGEVTDDGIPPSLRPRPSPSESSIGVRGAGGLLADRWGKARVAGAAMIASAACALVSPLFYGAPLAALLALAVIWGFTVVADSAQFSALVTEHTPRTHVGTALTLQTSAGFLLTMVSMRLVPPITEARGVAVGVRVSRTGPAAGCASDEETGPGAVSSSR